MLTMHLGRVIPGFIITMDSKIKNRLRKVAIKSMITFRLLLFKGPM
jgi:hypothetical protein